MGCNQNTVYFRAEVPLFLVSFWCYSTLHDSWPTCQTTESAPAGTTFPPGGPALCYGNCMASYGSFVQAFADTNACPAVQAGTQAAANRQALLNNMIGYCNRTQTLIAINGGSCILGTPQEVAACGMRPLLCLHHYEALLTHVPLIQATETCTRLPRTVNSWQTNRAVQAY